MLIYKLDGQMWYMIYDRIIEMEIFMFVMMINFDISAYKLGHFSNLPP